jgi:hypothetical protein
MTTRAARHESFVRNVLIFLVLGHVGLAACQTAPTPSGDERSPRLIMVMRQDPADPTRYIKMFGDDRSGAIRLSRDGRRLSSAVPRTLQRGDEIETRVDVVAVIRYPVGNAYIGGATRVRIGSLDVLLQHRARRRTPASSASGRRRGSRWSSRGDTTPSPSPCKPGQAQYTTCRLLSQAKSAVVDVRRGEPDRQRLPAQTVGLRALHGYRRLAQQRSNPDESASCLCRGRRLTCRQSRYARSVSRRARVRNGHRTDALRTGTPLRSSGTRPVSTRSCSGATYGRRLRARLVLQPTG